MARKYTALDGLKRLINTDEAYSPLDTKLVKAKSAEDFFSAIKRHDIDGACGLSNVKIAYSGSNSSQTKNLIKVWAIHTPFSLTSYRIIMDSCMYM